MAFLVEGILVVCESVRPSCLPYLFLRLLLAVVLEYINSRSVAGMKDQSTLSTCGLWVIPATELSGCARLRE